MQEGEVHERCMNCMSIKAVITKHSKIVVLLWIDSYRRVRLLDIIVGSIKLHQWLNPHQWSRINSHHHRDHHSDIEMFTTARVVRQTRPRHLIVKQHHLNSWKSPPPGRGSLELTVITYWEWHSSKGRRTTWERFPWTDSHYLLRITQLEGTEDHLGEIPFNWQSLPTEHDTARRDGGPPGRDSHELTVITYWE